MSDSLSRRAFVRLLALTSIMTTRTGTATQSTASIRLPGPRPEGPLSVERALSTRRSVREYTAGGLGLAEVSQVLWAAQGVTDSAGYRTTPSAGALYPLETYVVAGQVTDLPAGVYRYELRPHTLALVVPGDRRRALADAALQQLFIASAPVVLVLCAVYARTTRKYGDRGVRYVHMEAGHAAQNVSLQAVSLGLGTVVVGAFADARVRAVIGAAADEEPLYILPIGHGG